MCCVAASTTPSATGRGGDLRMAKASGAVTLEMRCSRRILSTELLRARRTLSGEGNLSSSLHIHGSSAALDS